MHECNSWWLLSYGARKSTVVVPLDYDGDQDGMLMKYCVTHIKSSYIQKMEHKYDHHSILQWLYLCLSSICKMILYESHDLPLASHPGHCHNLEVLQWYFFWPHMTMTINCYIHACITCQKAKSTTQHPFSLLQLLPIPQWPWTNVSLDFITGFLLTPEGHDVILVFVDLFSKMAHFVPMMKDVTTIKTFTWYSNETDLWSWLPIHI